MGIMYQVLYRKYRPKVFSDVYGQEHVTSTLINEIKENRISHAYLFTGSRGTGKTTCAKILAKAVNCEHNENGEPCNECEVCKGLDSGSIYDVVEIDAASNNGVDNIRDLREEANYTPTRGRYRVYIIDEVHMLSKGAFNALLKTLEEPPEHVVFILATTEVHMLPATILSRCQRFDFKRIQPETMALRLKEVAGFENMQLDDDAAILISRIADGGMRDALSILDQCAGRGSHIDSKLVSEVAGIAGREALYELSDAVCNQSSGDALNVISRLHQSSYDMERLCVEMINHFRNFLIVKTVKKSRELIICTDDEYDTIIKSAENFTLAKVIFALDLFQNTLTIIKGGANARIEMEMCFVKLCQPKLDASMEAVLDRIASLERAVKNGVTFAPVQSVKTVVSEQPKAESIQQPDLPDAFLQTAEKAEKKESFDIEKPIDNVEEAEAENPIVSPLEEALVDTAPLQESPAEAVSAPQQEVVQTEFAEWAEFMEIIYKTDIGIYGILNDATAYIRGEHFLFESSNPTLRQFIVMPTHKKAIKQAIFDVTGKRYKLGIFKNSEEKNEKKDPLEDLISKAQGNINVNIE
ncbi:MAG: DNA polymerase III subunit gamma/tau [Eubacterium sp.]|nr:DNA polymerase III subunit gamma/tau [Eubacterium sp.]